MELTPQTKAAIKVIDELSKYQITARGLAAAKRLGLVPKVDEELIKELRNWRIDLCLSGDDYHGTLLAIAIQQLGGDV